MNRNLLRSSSIELIVWLFIAVSARAEDKSKYHIFNPTPPHLMRPISTDRPDKTESAYTLDAGHFQLEMDLANFTYRRDEEAQTRAWNVAPFNIKAGVLNNADLQILFDNYIIDRSKESDLEGTIKREGIGDVTTRLKVNLWGNDGAETALAIMPFMKFPTNSNDLGNDSFEGGAIVPLAIGLSDNFGLGLMTEIDIVKNDDNSENHLDFVNTATVGHVINDEWGAYLEFFTLISEHNSSNWQGTVDIGVTFGVTEDIQLDAGINVGVTQAADDLNPFVGLSWRL